MSGVTRIILYGPSIGPSTTPGTAVAHGGELPALHRARVAVVTYFAVLGAADGVCWPGSRRSSSIWG
jgi:hypothetical protein